MQNAWVLHNTAWWTFGGAEKIVTRAADILLQEGWQSVQRLNRVTEAGDEISDPDSPLSPIASVWNIATESYGAWQRFQHERWEMKKARELVLSPELFRLTHSVLRDEEPRANRFDPMFALDMLNKHGFQAIIDATNIIRAIAFHLRDGLCTSPLLEPYTPAEVDEASIVSMHSEFNTLRRG